MYSPSSSATSVSIPMTLPARWTVTCTGVSAAGAGPQTRLVLRPPSREVPAGCSMIDRLAVRIAVFQPPPHVGLDIDQAAQVKDVVAVLVRGHRHALMNLGHALTGRS